MKRVILVLAVLVLILVSLIAIPRVRDELRWRWASRENTVVSYERYIGNYPSGRYAVRAKRRMELLEAKRGKFGQWIRGNQMEIRLIVLKEGTLEVPQIDFKNYSEHG